MRILRRIIIRDEKTKEYAITLYFKDIKNQQAKNTIEVVQCNLY